jgi:hypothetical protein
VYRLWLPRNGQILLRYPAREYEDASPRSSHSESREYSARQMGRLYEEVLTAFSYGSSPFSHPSAPKVDLRTGSPMACEWRPDTRVHPTTSPLTHCFQRPAAVRPAATVAALLAPQPRPFLTCPRNQGKKVCRTSAYVRRWPFLGIGCLWLKVRSRGVSAGLDRDVNVRLGHPPAA